LSNKLLKQGNKHKSLLNIVTLISYVLTATNKWLLISESRGDSNQCIPYRGNLIHMTHTLHAPIHIRHSYASCGKSLYVATFHIDPTELDIFTAPEKKMLLTPPLSPAEWPVGPASVSLPNTTIEAVHLSQTSIDKYATLIYWAHNTSM
jgi:hypothetical protein